MLYFLHFLIGVTTSFVGSLVPSMLNMTAAKISIQQSKTAAIKFAFGVSIVVFFQAYLATIFTKYLRENPFFIESLQKIAFVIFVLLSIYFYSQYKKEKIVKNESNNKTLKSNFAVGLLLSALNMFSIPFYCGVTTALDAAGLFQFSNLYIITFVVGATLGTFLLLLVYLSSAELIQSKAKGLSKNINLILSLLTGILAFVTLIRII